MSSIVGEDGRILQTLLSNPGVRIPLNREVILRGFVQLGCASDPMPPTWGHSVIP